MSLGDRHGFDDNIKMELKRGCELVSAGSRGNTMAGICECGN
jgi:hypothetical protein